MTSTPPAHVRDYTDGDFDACLALFDSNVPGFFTMPERPAFVEFLQHLPGPYLVIEQGDDGVVACGGYAIVNEERRADLCWGMVRQDLHGSGLGRLLTEARLQRAMSHAGIEVVALNTSQHTTGFYERLGFVVTEVIQNGYAEGLHRCEMRLVKGAPSSQPSIRPAAAGDRGELYRLIHALFPQNQADDLEAEVDFYLSSAPDAATILVAERTGGRLAGFIEVGTRPYAEGCQSSPVAYIEAWYVDSDVRRQGIGRLLFAAAEAWARERGYTEIASDAEIQNEISITAHRALGYEEVERIVCFRRSLVP